MAKEKLDIEKIERWYTRNLDIEHRVIYFGPWQPNEEIVEIGKDWEVNDWSAQNLIKGLYLLDKLEKTKIEIIWNSHGGDWYAGMAIYDFIKSLSSSVTIKAYGRIRSMGTIILQACHQRIIAPNCLFLIHYGELSFGGHSKNGIEAAEEEKRSNKLMEDIYLIRIKEKHKNYTRKRLQEFMKYDKYMTPQEAIEIGLADEVVG